MEGALRPSAAAHRDSCAQQRADAGSGGSGLPFCEASAPRGSPRYPVSKVIAPTRMIGMDGNASLKVSFWHATVEDSPQVGDPAFIGISMRTRGDKAWRNETPSGVISMLPFEGAHWRFEQPVSFVQYYLPFALLHATCDALFDRDLRHTDLKMSADVLDTRLHLELRRIQNAAFWIEPSNLLLDSWAVILSEALLRRGSSHGEHHARAACGKIAGRGIARVIDYVEAGIDEDLRLASLAEVAAMSVYHFARSFRKTVGMSPHAYVLSRRLTRAHAMLRRSEDGLAQVALSCGFSSQAHFTTAFHRNLGITPGVFRRGLRS